MRYGVLVAMMALAGSATSAQDLPLRERVDRLIESACGGVTAAPATDGEFVRRVYLDLVGFIPSVDEARDFIDDPSPYKRERLIDDLLARPEHARRMQHVFDEMWMERRPGNSVPRADWGDFLFRAFAANEPYDRIVDRVLAADGTGTAAERAPSKFLLDRQAEPNQVTRDIGRIFLGRDMQCAQCHDHPLIEDYKQQHYYGIVAFLSRVSLYTDPATQQVSMAEKADGDVTFESVFKKGIKHTTGPRLLDGPSLEEPKVEATVTYLVAPADKVRSVPAHSRRAMLSNSLTNGSVPSFDRNIANRMWALMMKRGLVQPLDLDHSDNPPSHPELLDLLAGEFRSHGCDLNAFLRELAMTRTYQRSSEPPPGASEDVSEPSHFAVATLKPMSAEQFGWSVMQATGVLENYRKAEESKLAANPKLGAILGTDAERKARRPWVIEQGVYEQLSGAANAFVPLFSAGEARSPDALDSSVHQALFLANGGTVQSWLAPSGGNLTGRMMQASTPGQAAEDLYLTVLSRRPTPEEKAEVASYLEKAGAEQKPKAVQDLSWALLTSAEFRFQH